MKTSEIIKVYKLQATPINEAECKDTWFENLGVKLNRQHLIQALIESSHMDGILPEKNLVSWYELQSWSDLVSLMDCMLDIPRESYLATLD